MNPRATIVSQSERLRRPSCLLRGHAEDDAVIVLAGAAGGCGAVEKIVLAEQQTGGRIASVRRLERFQHRFLALPRPLEPHAAAGSTAATAATVIGRAVEISLLVQDEAGFGRAPVVSALKGIENHLCSIGRELEYGTAAKAIARAITSPSCRAVEIAGGVRNQS